MSLATNMEAPQLDSQQGKFAALDRAKKGQFQTFPVYVCIFQYEVAARSHLVRLV